MENPYMKLTKLRKVGIVVGSVVLLWFVIFEWHFVSYTSDSPYNRADTCFSPNHEYYIKRYQTPFQTVMFKINPKGIAILYDKSGKELTRGFVLLRDGPIWSTFYTKSAVYYEGLDSNFYMDLPSLAGEHPDGERGCFNKKSDYVKPRPPLPPKRDFIVKGVEPLVKTKAPYQLQFLLADQHNIPFPSFKYIIYREDGSQQEGETDENGRTAVIESTKDEVIKMYLSPFQKEETFTRPEQLQAWCSRSPKECIRVEDLTFTANTIKVEPANTKAR
jgi:hypothetical protein